MHVSGFGVLVMAVLVLLAPHSMPALMMAVISFLLIALVLNAAAVLQLVVVKS